VRLYSDKIRLDVESSPVMPSSRGALSNPICNTSCAQTNDLSMGEVLVHF
jgi:hypothetical protein